MNQRTKASLLAICFSRFSPFGKPVSGILLIGRIAIALLALTLVSSCGSKQATEFSLEDYRGKWVVINYWATWCAPCIEEIPELNALAAEYEDQLAVLGVNYDATKGEELQREVESMGIEFATIENDPADSLRLSRPEGLPVTYLFSPEGTMKAKLVGPQTKQELLDRILLLGGPNLEKSGG